MGENTNPAMDAVQGFAQALQNAEDQAKASVTTGKDPHDLVAALSESKLAVETMVAVRDKVVEAYQEILRMQV
ncbi:MAG: flagellar hook-basal body complex protein FliE [Pseudomonadota bacterium]